MLSLHARNRPLQETLIALADQPGLYIVEAPMGMGKTEAALAVAYRRWTEGDEAGLYFALPTQLTSNRIHDRVAKFLHRTVNEPTFQTLVHGNAWLSEERIHRFDPATTSPGEADATEASRWFTSSRKPLLAPFGTGTIDQALMACISAYPLITKVVGNSATHHLVADPAIKESTVHLRHIPAENSGFIAEIARAAEAGACVLVIRNSVASAQQTFRAIKSALESDAIPVGLLLSRFPHF